MTSLALAMLAFLGSHYVLSHPAVRPRLAGALGEQGFAAAYSAIAGLGLAAAIWTFARSPVVPLWTLGPLRNWVALAAMVSACVLFVAGLTQRNPTMVMSSIEPAGSDPAPGVLKVTRHPMMWAFGLWGLGHVAANGHVAAVLFFGGVAWLALGGMRRIDAKRALKDPEGFARLAAATSNVPFAAILGGRQSIVKTVLEVGPLRIGAGLLLYALLVLAHPWIAGRAIGPG
ncbi:MAG: NnrU protein [Alphaproteobacteria bacterium]|nr:NnrU protein [Alphaproteobacteria bacterium]